MGMADLKLESYPRGLKSIKSKLGMADFKSSMAFSKLGLADLTLSFTFMHMCMITLSANIFLNKGQKFLHFFLQINYKYVY